MSAHLQQFLAYDDWANREAAASLLSAGAAAPQKAGKLLAHIIGAQWLWYARVRGRANKMAVWPELTAEQSSAESRLLLAAWSELVLAAGEAGLDRSVSYKNSKGEPWTSTVREIITHLTMHGAHHRGQIATLLRESGHEPAYTDYIHAVRTGRL
ncbi:MAG: DinB family protein [Candidatus Koribacter versatilis]|uniref:DinB family protein n=1 Tax=Candidatus Korobacter versatilis TaxID=658062 RepID=A0A932A848_9BACT|nr:DinB family protein [Candidatus Koribacter versatilis]